MGHDNDGAPGRVVANFVFFQEFKAVDPGHIQIEEDDIGFDLAVESLKRRGAVFFCIDRLVVAALVQVVLSQENIRFTVVYDQDRLDFFHRGHPNLNTIVIELFQGSSMGEVKSCSNNCGDAGEL